MYQLQRQIAPCAKALLRTLFIVTGLVLCAGTAGAQFRLSIAPPILDDYPIVKIPVQLRDNASKIEELTTADFRVTENGVPRTPLFLDCETDTTWDQITFLFVMDVSYSMRFIYGTRIEDPNLEKWFAAKAAFASAIDAMRPGDGGALYSLSEETRREVDYTTRKDDLLAGLDRMWFLPGTAIYDAIINVLADAEEYPGRKVMVLLTDGQDLLSTTTSSQAIAMAQGMNIPVFLIGLDVKPRDEPVLQRIAHETGGDYYYAPSSEKLQEVMDAISVSILSKKCILAYETGDTCRDGRMRNVEVTAAVPPYSASAQTAYTLPDNLERISIQLGNPGAQYDDEREYEIPFNVSGMLVQGRPLRLRATIEYDPALLEYTGLVPRGGAADESGLTVTELQPGYLRLQGDAVTLTRTIGRNEMDALFVMRFGVRYQKRIIISELGVSNILIEQDCPAVPVENSVPYTVVGCAREVSVALDSTVIAYGGREVIVPVILSSDLDEQQDLEFQFRIHYDPSLLTYKRIESEGTISENMWLVVTEHSRGELYISAAGGIPTGQAGALFRLVFDAEEIRDARTVDLHFEYARMEQTCIPLVHTSGNKILLDGTCGKIVRPRSFYLGQSAPNPAVSAVGWVSIPYAVTGSANVRLTVYDIDGKPLEILVDGDVPRGRYSARFNTSDLPSGTYMYVLREGDNVWTRKMIVGK